MQTISIINQKGGVAKSTTALAIGEGLALKGYKILFIDLDAQGNLTYTLNANARGSLEILQHPESIKREIQHLITVTRFNTDRVTHLLYGACRP